MLLISCSDLSTSIKPFPLATPIYSTSCLVGIGSCLYRVIGPTVIGTSDPPLHLGHPHLPHPRPAIARTGLPPRLRHHPVPGYPTPEWADHRRGDLQAGEQETIIFLGKKLREMTWSFFSAKNRSSSILVL